MKNLVLVIGACYGLLSVVLGAFGAHAFKKILSVEKLTSFEVGVRYQMYAASFLLFVGWIFKFDLGFEKWMSWLMIVGTLFFSVSIYLLAFQEYWGVSLRFLGPITPIGGIMMIASWVMLIFYLAKYKF